MERKGGIVGFDWTKCKNRISEPKKKKSLQVDVANQLWFRYLFRPPRYANYGKQAAFIF